MIRKKGPKKLLYDFVRYIKDNQDSTIAIKHRLSKLVEADVDLNAKMYRGRTLMHYAVMLNKKSMIKLFIKNGVNPNIADDDFYTPLHLAISKKYYHAARELLKHKVDINAGAEFEQTPLHIAVISGNIDLVKLLLDYGADNLMIDEKSNYPIDYAIDEKDIKMIHYLLTKQKVDDVRLNQIEKIYKEKR
jgi:protein phosphatase 1 regulatory inhibitor subunit 16B